ncbi:MAG: NAD(P)/FAD-dependent oxidoreductase [Gammaproteobacteria bacterium]|nr:NAD(P)/FAD-dependent oxidoreductase [Gammaproteobacteria bacterium]
MIDADVVIIGGGAAGLMCAIAAGRRGRKVIVLESSNRIGKKILMSGGGRCNFTNLHCEPGRFLSSNPHFCKSALSRYTQWDFIAMVERHSIPYHEKTLGQLFCDRSSKDIVAMLRAECDQANVEILTDCADTRVAFAEHFKVNCSKGRFSAESLVIASGGLSIPKMGASDFGHRIARQFGHIVVELRAGLVPFTLTGALQQLSERVSGVSCIAAVTAGGKTFTEGILFTHRGLSGPAMLQASNYWLPGESIAVDLFPGQYPADILGESKLRKPKALLRSVLSEFLPRALVAELQDLLWPAISNLPLGEIPDQKLRALADSLSAWSMKPAATEGYRTAEVTLGGVDTDQLSSQTMESRLQPGLYFIGEVVDVTGHLGGFNFQWAWASGNAAGQTV